jgi:hypothetical protein
MTIQQDADTAAGNLAELWNAVIVAASMSVAPNMKHVELLREHPILYEWKRPRCTRNGKILNFPVC